VPDNFNKLQLVEFDSFQVSLFRTNGLTAAESSTLELAHEFYGLQYPPPAGRPIAGVVFFPDGDWAMLRSDRLGRSLVSRPQLFPKGPGSGVHGFSLRHVEGGALTQFRMESMAIQEAGERSAAEAVLLLPKGPCTCCDPSIRQMMPPGTRLFVVDPGKTTIYESATGFTSEGTQFPRLLQNSLAPAAEEGNQMMLGSLAGASRGLELIGFLQPFFDALDDQEDQRDLEDQIRELDRQVRIALPSSLETALEIQYKGRGIGWKPRAAVTIEVRKTETQSPIGSKRSRYRLRLLSAKVGSDSVNSGPPSEPNWRPTAAGDPPIPGRDASFFANRSAMWREEHSFDWPLPSQWVEVYSQFREQMLWFDAVAANPNVSAEELMRLNRERFWIQVRFADLLDSWSGIVANAPPAPAPYNPAPAPGAFPRTVAPPPALPPFVHRRAATFAAQAPQNNGPNSPQPANGSAQGKNVAAGTAGSPATSRGHGTLTIESNKNCGGEGNRCWGSVTKTYKVATGENLSLIAGHIYGDPSKWRVIAEINGIKPPNYTVQAGQTLVIP
jgi:hypothetical protein